MKKILLFISAFILLATLQAVAQTTYYTVTLQATAVTGQNLSGTPVVFENLGTGVIYNKKLDNEGSCTITRVMRGLHSLTITHPDLATYHEEINIQSDSTLHIQLVEPVRQPYALTVTTSHDRKTGYNEITAAWNRETDYFFDDFESYDAFAIDFAPWSGIDGDNTPAAQLYGSYPNSSINQYATIFNPLVIDPPVWYEYPVLRPFSGKQYAAFIRTASGTANDDWLISPQIHVGVRNVLRFLAKAGDQYKEQFLVYISESGIDRADFTPLTKGNYESVDYKSWKTIQYDLSAYEGKDVHIAIRYISRSTFMLMVDDFFVGAYNIDPSARKSLNIRKQSMLSKNATASSEYFVVYLDGDSISETYNNQFTFRDVAPGKHTIGVEARYIVSKSERTLAEAALPAEQDMVSLTIEAISNGISPEGTEISYTDCLTGEIFTDTIRNAKSVHDFLPKGEYIINIDSKKFKTYNYNIDLHQDTTIIAELTETINQPYNLTADVTKNNDGTIDAQLRWNQELGWSDNFEAYTNFAQNFGQWTTYDGDQMITYPVGDANQNIYNFPGSGEKMACLIWNALATQPAMEGDYAAYAPQGEKCVAFFSPQQAKANDWLISPKIKIYNNYVIRFDLKAYTNLYTETIAICISEKDDPATFTTLDEIQATTEWNIMEIDLSEYAGKDMYIALHYTTYDGFFTLVDEFYIGPANEGNGEAIEGVMYEVFVDGKKIDTTDKCSYKVSGLTNEAHTAGIVAIYPSGKSEMTVIDIAPSSIKNTLNNGTKVYGSNGNLYVATTAQSVVTVTDLTGRLVTMQPCRDQLCLMLDQGCYIVTIAQNGSTSSYKIAL